MPRTHQTHGALSPYLLISFRQSVFFLKYDLLSLSQVHTHQRRLPGCLREHSMVVLLSSGDRRVLRVSPYLLIS